MAAELITAERLRELFAYDPDTGALTRRVTKSSRAIAGMPAGGLHCKGYISVNCDGRQYLAHRLAWLYVHGQWPAGQIDHINHVKTDNSIKNLRDVTCSVNQQNRRHAERCNPTGILGVHVRDGKFRASIGLNGKTHALGAHATGEQAHAAYLKAKRQMHPGNTL